MKGLETLLDQQGLASPVIGWLIKSQKLGWGWKVFASFAKK